MKSNRFSLAAVLFAGALALAACAQPGPIGGSTASPPPTAASSQDLHVVAVRLETEAENAYVTLATGYLDAVESGKLTGAPKEKVKAGVQATYRALLDLRAAEKVLGPGDLIAKANAVIALAKQVL